MAVCTFTSGTEIGDYRKPYIVAEVNTSHNGNLDEAKRMIDSACEAGCDCVKFQSWTSESLYSAEYYKQNPISKRIFNKFSFGEQQLLEVAEYCKTKSISFSSTPYSKEEVDFLLNRCAVPYIKIASMDINNYPFIDYIARTGAPIVLATGMGGMDEIREAVETVIKARNANLCLLHCISIYPPELETIRLHNILGLRDEFSEFPIGFSDHSLGVEIASAAVALGAAMIEKHLTLDKSRIGMDNQMAIEPNEMKELVRNCQNIHVALGDKERIVLQDELTQRTKMRRSIVFTRSLGSGHVLVRDDMDAKRPGTGFEPKLIEQFVGKMLANDVTVDSILKKEDLVL